MSTTRLKEWHYFGTSNMRGAAIRDVWIIFFIAFQLCLRFNPFSSAGERVYLLLLCFCVQLRRRKDKNCQQCGIPALFSLENALTKSFSLILEWGWVVLADSGKGSYQSSGQKELCQWLQQQDEGPNEWLTGLNLQVLKRTNKQSEISGGKSQPLLGAKLTPVSPLGAEREPGWPRVSAKSEE